MRRSPRKSGTCKSCTLLFRLVWSAASIAAFDLFFDCGLPPHLPNQKKTKAAMLAALQTNRKPPPTNEKNRGRLSEFRRAVRGIAVKHHALVGLVLARGDVVRDPLDLLLTGAEFLQLRLDPLVQLLGLVVRVGRQRRQLLRLAVVAVL